MFRYLYQMSREEEGAGAISDQAVDFAALFASGSSQAEIEVSITQALVHKLSRTLSMAPEDLDVEKPMHVYGVDSLVAVELRNWFAKRSTQM